MLGHCIYSLEISVRLSIGSWIVFSSVQFSPSVVSNSSQPHELQHARPPCPSPTSEFTQTYVHRVSDAIQPSHPLSSPSPPAPNPSQHQSLFKWVNTSHEVAKGLEFQLYHHSFQRNPRADFLQNGLVGSPCQEELPCVQGQGRQPGGATPPPRSGGGRGTRGPRGTIPLSRSGDEEIPLVQGKEQWLRFAGAAMKRYLTSKVRETQVRW